MTFNIDSSDTWYHLSKAGFIRGNSKFGSSLIKPFFLETMELSKFWPKHSSYASRVHFFSFVPLTIIASSRELVFANTVGRSLVCCDLKCTEPLFDWRALKIFASRTGCSFLLDQVDVGVDSAFLWDAFITKLLCNLLLMSCTKFFDAKSGWASFGREGGAKPDYWKIQNTIRCRRRIGCDALHWTRMSKADQAILLVGLSLPPNRDLYFGLRPGGFKNDIHWTSQPSLPRGDLQWVQLFPILGLLMNKDEGMDKRCQSSFCILTLCSRNGYKSFQASHEGRSHSFSFSAWSARTFPYLIGHVLHCCWLLPGLAFSSVRPEMALIRSRVSWCYACPLRKYELPYHRWRQQILGQGCWVGASHQCVCFWHPVTDELL